MEVQSRGAWQQVRCADARCLCTARVLGRAIVCTGAHCGWRAGHVVDYLARSEGKGYAHLLALLHEIYPQRLETVGGLDWAAAQSQLLATLTTRRALLDFLIAHLGCAGELTPEMALTQEWLAADGINVAGTRSFLLLSAPRLKELARLVSAITGKTITWDSPSGALVVPYFSDFLTVSDLLVRPLQPHPNETMWDIWPVEPTRLSFSGLWECPGGEIDLAAVLRMPLLAATHSSQSSNGPRPHLSVRHSPGVLDESPLRWNKLVYLLEENEDLRRVAELKALVAPGGLFVGHTDRPTTHKPWLEFLAQRMDQWMKADNQEAVRRDLESVVLSARERADWKALLTQMGLDRVAAFVADTGQFAERTHDVAGAKIFEAETGYRVALGKRPPADATNFTLSFERSVGFPTNTDLYRQGSVRFMGKDFPLLISNEALHHAGRLGKVVGFAVAAGGKALAETPTIFNAKLVLSLNLLFDRQLALLPRIEGVQQIGWSQDRRRFDSIGWRAEEGQVVQRETCADPEVMLLRAFNFNLPGISTDVEIQPQTENVPTWAGELLALMAAQAARVQHSRPAHPIVFRDTVEQRAVLRAVFAGAFGQTSPVQLGFNQRGGFRDIDLLCGHPCLAVGAVPRGGVQSCPLPFFLLSDSGGVRDYPGDQAQAIAFIRSGFSAVVHWLLTTQAGSLSFRHTALYDQDLLLEGREILARALDYHLADDLSEAPGLDALLAQTPVPSLARFFRAHVETQRLLVNLDAAPSALRPIVTAELRKLDPTFLDGVTATMDLVVGSALIAAFYRENVALPPASRPSYTRDEWVTEIAVAS